MILIFVNLGDFSYLIDYRNKIPVPFQFFINAYDIPHQPNLVHRMMTGVKTVH